ncbi:hypothetical protein [Corynebacterium sp.]|uniref:hypothetical protein n=1 Tax=Corynebacterium sp. TaxID=1720 RepID=UPI0037351CBC
MLKITRVSLAAATAATIALSGASVASADQADNPFGSSVTSSEYQIDENGDRTLVRENTKTRKAPQALADAWGSMQNAGQSSTSSTLAAADSSSEVPAWVIPVAGVLGAVAMLVAVLNFLVPAWSIDVVPLI